jgi:hypothetical protein
MKTLALGALANGMPGLTPGQGTVMAEAASMCFDGEGHSSPVAISIDGDFVAVFRVSCLPITDQMRHGYRFDTRVTDQGACGVALLVIAELTDYEVVEEADRGTYFDYWLAPKGAFLFQGSARLEISGLRNASDADIASRARRKQGQIDRSPHRLPGFVAVVEFSRPLVRVVQR